MLLWNKIMRYFDKISFNVRYKISYKLGADLHKYSIKDGMNILKLRWKEILIFGWKLIGSQRLFLVIFNTN